MQYKIDSSTLPWREGKIINGFTSKELLEVKEGSFKIVQVTAMADYPEHIHPDKTEYAFVLEGNCSFTINGEHVQGKPGDFFLFPSNVKHAIFNKGLESCRLIIGSYKHK